MKNVSTVALESIVLEVADGSGVRPTTLCYVPSAQRLRFQRQGKRDKGNISLRFRSTASRGRTCG